MLQWRRRLTVLRRVLLVALIVALFGLLGSLVFDYVGWPFQFIGLIAVIANFVLFVRDGMQSPVSGRPDLDS